VRLERTALDELDTPDAFIGENALRLRPRKQLDSQVLKHLPEERARLLVQLPAERPRAAVEDKDANVELCQIVRGLKAEEPCADDYGRPAATAPNVLLDLNCVVDRSEHEAAFRADTVDRRNNGRAPVAMITRS
jgi:hypothetical protein